MLEKIEKEFVSEKFKLYVKLSKLKENESEERNSCHCKFFVEFHNQNTTGRKVRLTKY